MALCACPLGVAARWRSLGGKAGEGVTLMFRGVAASPPLPPPGSPSDSAPSVSGDAGAVPANEPPRRRFGGRPRRFFLGRSSVRVSDIAARLRRRFISAFSAAFAERRRSRRGRVVSISPASLPPLSRVFPPRARVFPRPPSVCRAPASPPPEELKSFPRLFFSLLALSSRGAPIRLSTRRFGNASNPVGTREPRGCVLASRPSPFNLNWFLLQYLYTGRGSPGVHRALVHNSAQCYILI